MAITLDQNVSKAATFADPSTSLAFSSAVAAGQLLTFVASLPNTVITSVSTVTDSLGNTWKRAVASTSALAADLVELWYVANSLAGTPTVTVTVTSTISGATEGLGIHAWLGASSLASVLVQTATTSTGNSSAMAMPSIAATSSNLVIGVWRRGAGGTLRSLPAGYSTMAPGNVGTVFCTMYKTMGGSSNEAPVWTFTAAGAFSNLIGEFAIAPDATTRPWVGGMTLVGCQ